MEDTMRKGFTVRDEGIISQRPARPRLTSEGTERGVGFLRREKSGPIRDFILHCVRGKDRVEALTDMRARTRPGILGGVDDHLGPHGIAFHIAKRGHGMERIQRDTKEPPLPQIPPPACPEVDGPK